MFNDKIALITDESREFGRNTALRLAEAVGAITETAEHELKTSQSNKIRKDVFLSCFAKNSFGFARLHCRTLVFVFCLFLGGTISLSAQTAGNKPDSSTVVQFYTLDCGRLEIKDMGVFSDTDEHAGESGTLAVPCYLIHHGKDWMLWDAGLGDRAAAKPDGEVHFGSLRFIVRRTLASQLAQLGLKPDDANYVALSHLHADHSGNINLFPKSTFLIAAKELEWARSVPTPEGVEPSFIQPLEQAKVNASDDDRDVFGDGTVRILKAPGHTPGHRMLLVKLAKSGALLITGDLYHTRENYEKGLVPTGNTSRAETLASFSRFTGLAARTHGRVIVQHSPKDFASMPLFPKYLD